MSQEPYDIVMRYTMARLEERRRNLPVAKYTGLHSQIYNAVRELERRIGPDGRLLWPRMQPEDFLFLVPNMQLGFDILDLFDFPHSNFPIKLKQINVVHHLGDYFMIINKQVFDPRYMLNHLYRDAIVCVLTPEGWEKQNK